MLVKLYVLVEFRLVLWTRFVSRRYDVIKLRANYVEGLTLLYSSTVYIKELLIVLNEYRALQLR